ncbi:MAG: HlyD family efflux transporter periplasmic adaptor subunit [Proteobacteria bacterium]|nr:HlyD family efflux transporter periplasmic adaptor subunit [Pseudomonadota bacterium]
MNPPAAPAQPTPEQQQRRRLLMWGVPTLVVLVGVFFWLYEGRFESTDDAYVQQDMIMVSSDISGRITAVNVTENQPVQTGQVLFTFDPVPYELALQNAKAAVVNATAQVEQLKGDYRQSEADIGEAKANLALQQATAQRLEALRPSGAASQAQVDAATYQLKAARDKLASAQSAAAKALAALQGNPDIETGNHALVQAAEARLGQAQVDLSHTTVVAPADGMIAQTGKLQVGQYLQPGSAVMSLVKSGRTWVEANFKETQLTYMRVGQPATVSVDAYPGVTLGAVVESLGAGTGAQFSLLPAQNATGNWVKVVQRVPVRLRLTQLPAGVRLQSGLSVVAEVDTGHRRLYRYLHHAPHQDVVAAPAETVSATWPAPPRP